MSNWDVAQQKELDWQKWYYLEHIPLKRRYQVEGYRLCEGRYMALHCGIPQGGLQFEDIQGDLLDDGSGAVSVWEHRPNLEVTAIDPLMVKMTNDSKLGKFARVGPKNNAFYIGQDIENIGMSGKFDWVWCYNVLDHTAEWMEHLNHCKRVLKPGGVLLLGADVRTLDYDFNSDDERDLHPSVFSASELLYQLAGLRMKLEWCAHGGGQVTDFNEAIKVVDRFSKNHPKFRLGVRARK